MSKKYNPFVPDESKGNLHDRVGVKKGDNLPDGLAERILKTPIGEKCMTPGGMITVTARDHKMTNYAINMQKGENAKR